jgi:hypothetical protein
MLNKGISFIFPLARMACEAGRGVWRQRSAGLALRSVGGSGRYPTHVVAGCAIEDWRVAVRPGAR